MPEATYYQVQRDAMYAQVRGGVVTWADTPSAAAALPTRVGAQRLADNVNGIVEAHTYMHRHGVTSHIRGGL